MTYEPYKGGKFTKIIFIDSVGIICGSYEYNPNTAHKNNVATMLDMVRNLWLFDDRYCIPYTEVSE